jgi:polar amino acid transport system permease protein
MAFVDNFNRFVLANLGPLFSGLWVTVYVCFWAFLLALLLGAVVCFVRLRIPYLKFVAIAYIEFFRATPILVQLLWVNYVWPEVFGFPRTVTGAGILALALQSSGYLAETFRAGIEGVPRGQREAAFSAGMSPAQTFARIVMPQVTLASAPSIVNQFTVIVKSSTLVSVITVPDLMSESQRLVNVWYEPIEILTATAAIYVLFVFLVSLVGKLLADHLRRRYGLAAT